MYLSNRTVGQLIRGEKMKFLADMAHKRRWVVLFIWVFAIVGVGGAAKSAGTAFSSSFELQIQKVQGFKKSLQKSSLLSEEIQHRLLLSHKGN